jgi:tetratricopeptide (TPR) repeat protein
MTTISPPISAFGPGAAQPDCAAGQALTDPRLRDAANLLETGQLRKAETVLREFVKEHPSDLSALRLLAEIATQQSRFHEAEELLAKCVGLAPTNSDLRYSYVNVLLEANKNEAALVEIEKTLAREPRNSVFRGLKAIALEAIEDYGSAAALWREVIEESPTDTGWLRYGHAVRYLGRTDEAVAAYRNAIALNPTFGRAHWSLASLKTFRFADDEIARLESHLRAADLPAEDRPLLHLALGKAYADKQQYDKSFSHYAKGNALQRLKVQYDPDAATAYVAQCKAVFTAEFFRERDAFGASDGSPIFIVGMPRSGSTLIEQMLASHSQIEGTKELAELSVLLKNEILSRSMDYPAVLTTPDKASFNRLGELYLETTRIHRKLGRPFFTDKMGTNAMHVGLLQLILPKAKIVDVRRHPLACCLSNFTEYFAKGQDHRYRLTDCARLYRDYVELMAHFDRVLPGKVHRVIYEQLVADPETELRRLLDYLGLPFEERCLKFYETGRPINTVSSEQVRRPIFRDGLERWRSYEPWLGPVKAALGPVLEAYPEMPATM